MDNRYSFLRTAACLALALPAVTFAQQPSQFLSAPVEDSAATAPVAAVASIVKPATPAPSSSLDNLLDRWLDISSFTYANRYRSVFAANGAHSFSQGQERLLADGKFKFDAGGKYGVAFHLSSGRYFNWAYADYMGGGQHQFIDNIIAKSTPLDAHILGSASYPTGFFNSGGGAVYFRQLYLIAQPIKGIEVQFGGLAIEHGVNTEATSYDDDGYMSGERIIVKRPKQLFFSELSYTRGYIGDLYTPNFFARGGRLAQSNYWQIMGRKDFGNRLSVSADYSVTAPEGDPTPTYAANLHTTREALYADVHESKVFDSVRFEAYQRLDALSESVYVFQGGKGYAFTVSRSFAKHGSIDAGIANIDPYYFVYVGNNGVASIVALGVNGDQYGSGQRYFVRPTVKLNHYLSLAATFNHVFDYTSPDPIEQIWNKQYLAAGVVVDVKSLLFHNRAL
jgi:hypothetical protein